MDTERLLTVREAARRMHVSTQTIYNWVKAGQLRVVRVGRTIRIAPQDLPTSQPPAEQEAEKKALAEVLAQAQDTADSLGLSPVDLLEAMMRRAEQAERERDELRKQLATQK